MSQGTGEHMPGWRRLVPGGVVLLGYRRAWLRGDLLAGLTVAAYLVPQVMAYAGVAGLSPVTGLWAILPALALYALFGSSRLLSVGPESTTALMTATVVAPLAAGAPGATPHWRPLSRSRSDSCAWSHAHYGWASSRTCSPAPC